MEESTPAAKAFAGKRLQITIDDGPQPVAAALNPILTEIGRRGVKAAFFIIGQEVQADPAATNTIRDAGHVLGNHSFDHLEPRTSAFSDAQIVDSFQRAHNQVRQAPVSVTMQHWRAPRLDALQRLSGLLVGSGRLYTLSHCDVNADSNDSQGADTAAEMLSAIRSSIAAQSSRTNFRLLFHVLPTTAAALRAVLDGLVADGHTLVDFTQAS